MKQKFEASAMAIARAEHLEAAQNTGPLRAMLEAFDSPAMVVENSGTILAANAAWHEQFAISDRAAALPPVSEWLAQLTDGALLAAALEVKDAAHGLRTACVSHHGRNGVRRFTARVTSVQDGDGRNQTHCVVLVDPPAQSSIKIIDETQHTMHRLLVRQTVIEERERRRLGRALHDQVTQVLVHVRRRLAETRDGRRPQDLAEVIANVDRVVHMLHELTSNFSPPVLEDLGLLPAMHWLADHLQSCYGASASCEDDGVEPVLSSEVRTIAFRAIRELANNAVKHAPGARILLRSNTNNDRCRLEVFDDGPGFARLRDDTGTDQAQPFPGYGLLSIEQQIRAVGGTFEIHTAPGEGTRAIIELSRSSDEREQDQDDA
jgi:signal transduction histidine kinase